MENKIEKHRRKDGVQLFVNKELELEVRVVEINGEGWLVGKDIAEVLGYSNTRDAISRHVDKEDKNTVVISDGKGNPNKVVINESGFYSLILRSDMPKAKEFKRWVTSEVLPSIRKTGSYMRELKAQEKMFQLMRSEINEIVSIKIKEIEDKCSDYYRPSSLEKNNISSYIKKRLGITKVNDEYELVKQRVLLKLGATKWEDISVEDLRDSLHIIDESIRVIKLDRPTQQLSMFY
ncbi:MAG: Bro-N domain-containing protein [Clostridium celatum]|uniref:BRO-N domain-containing protein n=1 Tax=Clostridium celatum TaxID=36834 RepID=UPI001F3A00AE|nr:Bro-N domain-containing protein [Clostridium celatum]MCE9655658.1 Bro-N domain-containing protein [Clostridium celatum]MDU3722653.1 Bro-N domain-containing protein [Clostridium celatum]